ncbi:hypothetical protein KM043_014511 [Ampulex compressa]|nr:hypothetical protein KM043_014511 [Ampulex compressa]
MDSPRKPFDVETTYADAATRKKKRPQKFRGPEAPLYTSVYPMFYIVKIFGLAPYEFSNDQLVPSNVCFVFSVIFLGIYFYVMYLVFLRFTGLKRETPVLGGTETSKVIFNFSVAIYDILLSACTRKTFAKIWNSIQDYDVRVDQLGYACKEMKTGIVAWLLLLLNTVIWVTVNKSGMYAFLEKWSYNVGYMCVYIGTSVSVYKFVGMAFFLGQRFGHLNRLALRNLPPITGPIAPVVVDKREIQNLHNDLMIAAESLGSLYSWSLLFWLGNLSMHSVSNMYFVIDRTLLTSWEYITWPLTFCLCSWLMVFVSQLLVIHIACHFASTQANKMGAILVQWDVRRLHGDCKDDDVDTSLHLINRRLHFTAGGCFNVDLQLLRSLCAVLTTYLVILLQMPDT